MTSLSVSGGTENARRLVDRLIAEQSPLGRELATAWDSPLGTYLAGLWTCPPNPSSRWLELLTRALHAELRRQVGLRATIDCSAFDPDEVCAEFLNYPVLQQADHANLLLDPETFLNNLLFHVSATLTGQKFVINSQCSTVVCFSRRVPPTGPVYLHTRGQVLNVFGFSKNRYRRANFCALRGPLRITLSSMGNDGKAMVATDRLLDSIRGSEYDNPEDAYLQGNERIWSNLPVNHEIERIQIDERTTSHTIALHLNDQESPIYQLLIDTRLRQTFEVVKREIVSSACNIAVNRATPDWFWWRRGERLHALVESDCLRSEVDGNACPIPLQPKALAAALQDGVLVGDRILSYLARCLLPGVVAVGGTVQQDYVNAYRLMLLETHRRVPFLDEGAVRLLTRRDLSRLGGAPLLELDAAGKSMVADLNKTSHISHWVDEQMLRPVRDTVGNLSCAWFYEDLLQRVTERRTGDGGTGER